jgi:hypothetical protein
MQVFEVFTLYFYCYCESQCKGRPSVIKRLLSAGDDLGKAQKKSCERCDGFSTAEVWFCLLQDVPQLILALNLLRRNEDLDQYDFYGASTAIASVLLQGSRGLAGIVEKCKRESGTGMNRSRTTNPYTSNMITVSVTNEAVGNEQAPPQPGHVYEPLRTEGTGLSTLDARVATGPDTGPDTDALIERLVTALDHVTEEEEEPPLVLQSFMALLVAEFKAQKKNPLDSKDAFKKMVKPVLEEKKSVRKLAEAACLSVEELEH